MLGSPAARRGANTAAASPAIAFCPSRGSAPAPVSSASRSCASPAGIDSVRGGARSAPSSHCGSSRKQHPLAALGLASRCPTNGAQPQPSRYSVAFDVHAPSRSGQSASPSRASNASAIATSTGAASASLAGGAIPTARAIPATVGTANRAG